MSWVIVIARSPIGETSKGCGIELGRRECRGRGKERGEGAARAVLNRLKLREAVLQGGSPWQAARRAAARELRAADRVLR